MSFQKAILFLLLPVFILGGCKAKKAKNAPYSARDVQEALIAYNKRLADNIHAEIDSFVAHSQQVFVEDEDGFYYSVIAKGNGNFPEEGNKVTCLITFKLLDGTVCYPEKEGETSEFVIGKHNLSIVNNGVLNVDVGGEIEVISSPYMGFGLNGDGNRIPPARPYLVNISLLKVNNETLK